MVPSSDLSLRKRIESEAWNTLLCRYSSGPRIADDGGMLTRLNLLMQLKRRYAMSPLMLMLLLSLVPFPILVVAILAERWLKATQKATS
jgi:hypothetical protein